MFRKYKLVPQSLYETLNDEVSTLAMARDKIYRILNSKKLSASDKTAMFQDLLSRMRQYISEINQPPIVQLAQQPTQPLVQQNIPAASTQSVTQSISPVQPSQASTEGSNNVSSAQQVEAEYSNLSSRDKVRLRKMLKKFQMNDQQHVVLGNKVLTTKMPELIDFIFNRSDIPPIDYSEIASYYRSTPTFKLKSLQRQNVLKTPTKTPVQKISTPETLKAPAVAQREAKIARRLSNLTSRLATVNARRGVASPVLYTPATVKQRELDTPLPGKRIVRPPRKFGYGAGKLISLRYW